MITWRGWGIWVFAQFFFWLIGLFVASMVLLNPGNSRAPAEALPHWITVNQSLDLLLVLICLCSALTSYAMSRYRKSHPAKITDSASGRVIVTPWLDDLWHVEIAYWPWIFIALGLGATILAALNIGPGN